MSSKITALTATTAPLSTDILPIVTDPAGTPANKKVALSDAITKGSGLGSGIVKSTAGTLSVATSGTDYGPATTALATGILKNTTTTGAHTIAVAGDFPTLNQDTTGKSAKTDALNSATTVVNVSSATAPSNGQVLTATSSTAATWQTPAGGGGSSTPRITLTNTMTETANGRITGATSNGGALFNTVGGVHLRRGTTSVNGGASVSDQGILYNTISVYNRNPVFWAVADGGQFTATENYTTYIIMDYIGDGSAAYNGTGVTYVGFKIINNAGTEQIYSVHADGTNAEVATLLTPGSAWSTNTWVFTAVVTSGTNIKFYINSTLRATHTTNLPAGTMGYQGIYQATARGNSGTLIQQSMGVIRYLGLSFDAY